MDFRSLEYFLTVVDTGSFTKAAAKLYLTQQSTSEYIKRLEEEVGTPLLLRKRPLVLTEAGDILARSAREILRLRSDALHEIAESHEFSEKKIVIAISTFEAPPFLPDVLAAFGRKHPYVELCVTKRIKDTLTDHLDGIDFYYDFSPLAQKLDHIPLVRNDCYCVVLRSSLLKRAYGSSWEERLRRVRETGNLAELSMLPFSFLKGYSHRIPEFTTALFRSFGFEPVIGFQSDNGDLNSAMCLQGRCAQTGSFFYERSRFCRELDRGDDPLLLLPLRTPRNSVSIAIGFQRGKSLSAIETSFIAANRAYINAQIKRFTSTALATDQIPDAFFY